MALVEYCLELVNDGRTTKLAHDEKVSKLAQAYAEKMAESGSLSHGSDGQKPYQRYGLGGVRDHIIERIAGQDVDFGEVSEASMRSLVHKARESIAGREEAGPAMDPAATHVGFGAAVTATHFRYVEVILFRYVDLDEVSCPETLQFPQIHLSGTMLRPNFGPYAAMVYYDAFTDEPTFDDELFYDDFSEDRLLVVWPWNFDFHTTDGSFTASIELPSLRPGTYYIQLFVRKDPASIPYAGEVDGVEIPGSSICATGLVLRVPVESSHEEVKVHPVILSAQPKNDSEARAQKDAKTAALKPDREPLASLMLCLSPPPGEGWEMTTYGTGEFHGLAFKRLALDEIDLTDESDPRVVVDVAIAGGPTGLPVNLNGEKMEPPAGYEVLEPNLNSKSIQLCACYAPASEAGLQAIVDVVVVFGGKREEDDDAYFDVGGGFETIEIPAEAVQYDGVVYVCFKREGSGRAAAEQQRQLEEAIARPLPSDHDEEPTDHSSDDDDDDESLLDTTLTPEQVKELEEKKATAQREAEARAAKDALEKADARRKSEEEEEMRQLMEKKAELLQINADLQKKLAVHFYLTKEKATGADPPSPTESKTTENAANNHEAEKQYAETLSNILELKRRSAAQKAESDRMIYELQSRLDEKEFKAKKIADSFREFKREIALSAEHSRTSKPIPRKVIQQFEELEAKKEHEVEKVRLKNINLRMTLKKLEQQLRAKEQLAEGLHLIDFEQLKIENQSLREKIEERDDELSRLKKKNTANVQVLTHIKEKLHFVNAQNKVDQKTLSDLDANLATERDKLTKLKAERDSLRASNLKRKQAQGFANSDLLIMDYEKKKAELEVLHQRIDELKHRHAMLVAQRNHRRSARAAKKGKPPVKPRLRSPSSPPPASSNQNDDIHLC